MKRKWILSLAAVLSFGILAGCVPQKLPSDQDQGGDGSQTVTEENVTFETYGSFWMRQHDYKTMPVGAYNSCPPQMSDYTYSYIANESTFEAYSEAGVNTMMGLREYAASEEVAQALDWCTEYGLAYLLPLAGAESFVSDSIAKSTLSRVKYHDAFAGIMQSDEPGRTLFEKIRASADILDSIMPEETTDVLWHVNLFPTYANEMQLYYRQYTDSSVPPEGGYTYDQYISDYMEICNPKVLSYDYYPCVGNSLRDGYFENMSIIREAASEANIPFWVFIQTCSFGGGTRVPNEADILWQVNTALSYGAKGIQYFTGVLPSDGAETFTGAMFDRDGNRTEVYEYVKKANKQLTAADEVLMCSKSAGLIVTGLSPWGTDSKIHQSDLLTEYGVLKGVEGEHILTGCFDYKGTPAYYVTNNSIGSEDEAKFTFSENIKGYTVQNGEKAEFNGKTLSLTLQPGEGVLIVVNGD